MFRYAYWAVGETELAVDDFTAAVELKADYSEARLNRPRTTRSAKHDHIDADRRSPAYENKEDVFSVSAICTLHAHVFCNARATMPC